MTQHVCGRVIAAASTAAAPVPSGLLLAAPTVDRGRPSPPRPPARPPAPPQPPPARPPARTPAPQSAGRPAGPSARPPSALLPTTPRSTTRDHLEAESADYSVAVILGLLLRRRFAAPAALNTAVAAVTRPRAPGRDGAVPGPPGGPPLFRRAAPLGAAAGAAASKAELPRGLQRTSTVP
jgi:hypothetical protein